MRYFKFLIIKLAKADTKKKKLGASKLFLSNISKKGSRSITSNNKLISKTNLDFFQTIVDEKKPDGSSTRGNQAYKPMSQSLLVFFHYRQERKQRKFYQ